MARKRLPAAPRLPTVAEYDAAVQSGNPPAALDLAKRRHAGEPTPHSLALLRVALIKTATYYAMLYASDDCGRVCAEAAKLAPDDVAWQEEIAVVLARVGVLKTESPAARLHFCDWVVRTKRRESLPPDLLAEYDALRLAFDHYEKGRDDAAREQLQLIGLQSPFLEWKLLLRGLIAYTANDDARAIENWQRLSTDRLALRLAVPLRMAIDPAFAASLTGNVAVAHQRQYEALTAGELTTHLRGLQAEFGRDKPLTNAWKKAAAVVPLLRKQNPNLEVRLARLLYGAIITQGEPSDIGRYKTLFGLPPDDPHFARLEAMACESRNRIAEAIEYWASYEKWLATNPPGWPVAVVARARAIILSRMGEQADAVMVAVEAEAEVPDDFRSAFERLLGPQHVKPRLAMPRYKPEDLFRKAAALAPEWDEPGLRLFTLLDMRSDQPGALAAAQQVLAVDPANIEALKGVAAIYRHQGRGAENLAAMLRLLAANPLDKSLRQMTGYSVLGAARHALAAGNIADAQAILITHHDLCRESLPAFYLALVSTVARKQRLDIEADAAAATALATPGARLAVALYLNADAIIARLKPADRKIAATRLANALAEPPQPREVALMFAAWDSYQTDRLTYTGQKLQEKKIVALIVPCLAAAVPEQDFEQFLLTLVDRKLWKPALAVGEALVARFPGNVAIKVYCAQALDGVYTRCQKEMAIAKLLAAARIAIDARRDPKDAALLERILALAEKYSPSVSPFESLFNRRRR